MDTDKKPIKRRGAENAEKRKEFEHALRNSAFSAPLRFVFNSEIRVHLWPSVAQLFFTASASDFTNALTFATSSGDFPCSAI
jgi:hypothetical protein